MGVIKITDTLHRKLTELIPNTANNRYTYGDVIDNLLSQSIALEESIRQYKAFRIEAQKQINQLKAELKSITTQGDKTLEDKDKDVYIDGILRLR